MLVSRGTDVWAQRIRIEATESTVEPGAEELRVACGHQPSPTHMARRPKRPHPRPVDSL